MCSTELNAHNSLDSRECFLELKNPTHKEVLRFSLCMPVVWKCWLYAILVSWYLTTLLKLKNMLLHPSTYWEPTIWQAPFMLCEIPQIHKTNKNKNPILVWFTFPQRERNNLHGKACRNCCGENEVGCGKSGCRGTCGYNSDCSGQGDYLETLIPEEKT